MGLRLTFAVASLVAANGCGGAGVTPTIADVHTDPNTNGPEPPGQVLHVDTGAPRLMVMTADSCMGPRVFVGLASSYYQKTTTNFQRLNDADWSHLVATEPDVAWMKDLVSH